MILIFDIGKTNKKCFVFDGDYHMVFERSTQLPETTDEDGDPCEDVYLLTAWVQESLKDVLDDPRFQIRAINVATYGASFVHLSPDAVAESAILTPLYNYLKSFPTDLRKQFFGTYGGEAKIALETASPVLGHLNSGLQLYWIKHCKPLIFNQIKWSIHLPQYIAHTIRRAVLQSDSHPATSIIPATEITSIGCHTLLWDFRKNDYHDWVKAEGIEEKFPPIIPARGVFRSPRDDAAIKGEVVQESPEQRSRVQIGTGLHDSSAALIPYLACFDEPFVLISTGTWCISLNPFNRAPLRSEELAQDCLCYLTYEGKPVKAARFFGGHEHEMKVKELAAAFGVADVPAALAAGFKEGRLRNLQGFVTADASAAEAAYLEFMRQLVEKQVVSTRLALGDSPVRRIFVDGGFSKNETYMTLLAEAFPEMEVFAAEVAQATALGAALAMHAHWNKKPIPQNLISLKKIRV